MLAIDTHTGLLAQIELLNKNLVESSLNQANVSKMQALKCDLCEEGHANEMWSLEGSSEVAQFSNSEKNNSYSNTYNPGWKDHPNFRWSNNQNISDNQSVKKNNMLKQKGNLHPLRIT